MCRPHDQHRLAAAICMFQFCLHVKCCIKCCEAHLQADRRALNITLNSIGTELTRDDRRKLYSNFGLLYPHGHYELAGAEDFDQIRSAMEKCPPYQAIFTKVCGTACLTPMCHVSCLSVLWPSVLGQ